MDAKTCSHRALGSDCPISKTPCLGECIYASILDEIGLGILGLDIKKQEVFFQNKLAQELFKDIAQPKDYRALAALLLANQVLPTRPAQVSEPRRLQLGRRFVGYSIYFISESYLWIYLSDITEKMRLNAIAEAVNSMNNLGYLFSGIRHELGNPVNSIKTTITVLKKNLASYSKETVAEFVDRVISDLNRVEMLLKNMKSFSMYEHPECIEVSLEPFLANVLSIVERDFGAKRIRIRTAIGPGAERALFDPRAMQQVLLNLLTNACDAFEETRFPEITLAARRDADRVVIEIIDNGRGIPEEQKRHLFKPFSTTKPHGTGLGLVIVKNMLLKMNAIVEIESQEKVGTTVALSLPLARGEHA